MLKSLTAGITALSLTLATAMPAQANGVDREDVGKLLIGLAAVAVIGAAIENNNRSNRRVTRVHDRTNHAPHVTPPRANDWAGLNRSNRRNILPHDCVRRVETRFGNYRMFGHRCLERNYRHVNSLPARCAVRVYSNNGPRRGFDPLCLREQGYRSDRRH